MSADILRRPERAAYSAIVCGVLAPVVAHGLWRPMAHVFGLRGASGAITGAALSVTAAILLVRNLRAAATPLWAFTAGALTALGATLGFSLGAAGLASLLGVAATVAFVSHWLPPRLPAALDGLAARHRRLTALYLALSVFAVVSTARVSIFIGDAARTDRQALPGQAFLETHSCLTAYVQAAALARQRVDNLYDEHWWQGAHGFPSRAAGADNPYRPFLLDYYAYPPPFLLALAPLAPLDGDYAAQRALWFGLNGLLLALALWIVARWVDGPGSHRALLVAPIFYGSLPVLATLQVGNFQIAVVALAVLAMVAIDRDHLALGGALLAFAMLSKISPGVLAIVLVAERRWRAAAWTAGFGVLFIALSIASIGVDPLRSFLTYALPRIASGQAFAFLDATPFNVVVNMSPFGLPFKLNLMGLRVGDPWAMGRRLGHVYTVALAAVTVVSLRRRGRDRRTRARVWMSLLVLAALQSPFAPAYVTIGLLWAMTLGAVEVRTGRGAAALVVLWIWLTAVPPISSIPLLAANSLLQSLVTVGVCSWLVLRRADRASLRSGQRLKA